MKFEEKEKLLDDLSFLELPIKKNIIKQIEHNDDMEIIEAWRNRRVVMVNGKNANNFNKLLVKHNLFNYLFKNQLLKNIYYYEQNHSFYINLKMKYLDVIEDYLRNGKINPKLKKKYSDHSCGDELINEMNMIGIALNEEEKKEIKKSLNQRLLHSSLILLDNEYDDSLKEWLGVDTKWKLLYRASEHDYTPESFHEYCDDKGPTLVIIESTEGWIFGGYTTQSWSGDGIYLLLISLICV